MLIFLLKFKRSSSILFQRWKCCWLIERKRSNTPYTGTDYCIFEFSHEDIGIFWSRGFPIPFSQNNSNSNNKISNSNSDTNNDNNNILYILSCMFYLYKYTWFMYIMIYVPLMAQRNFKVTFIKFFMLK